MQPAIRLFIYIVGLLTATSAMAGIVDSDTYREDRALFLKAGKALDENRAGDYRRLAKQLQDYPLYPYLQFRELRARLRKADPDEIRAFIERHRDDPLGRRLRQTWLYTLAKQRDWPQFLAAWHGRQPVKLQCYKLQAQINTGQTAGLVEHALKLWMVGKSQEKTCDPVFSYLEDNNKITRDLLWQRIRLAMNNGNTGLARYLAKRLPEKDAAWVTLWRAARAKPARTLESPELKKDTPEAREIILYSIRRIARTDADQAHRRWEKLKPHYRFTQEQTAQLEKKISKTAN